MLSYDVYNHIIKLASHVLFDEDMNDLPMADTPLNVQNLQRVDNGQPLPEEQNSVPTSQFELSINTFTYLLPVLLKCTPYYTDPTFGFTFQYDDLLKRAFVKTIQPKYPASEIFSNPKSTNNKLRGAFVTSVHGTRVFTSADALKQLRLLHEQVVLGFSLTFAPEKKSPFKEVRKATNEYGLFSPNARWDKDAALAQIKPASKTTDTEVPKERIVDKVHSIHAYYEDLYARIHYSLCPTCMSMFPLYIYLHSDPYLVSEQRATSLTWISLSPLKIFLLNRFIFP